MRVSRFVITTCGALGLATLFSAPVMAQTRPAESSATAPARMPPALRAAQELIFASYPELVERQLEVQATFENGEWLVSVAAVPLLVAGQPGALTAGEALPVLIRARAKFDATNQLERFSADGPFLFDVHNATLRETLRQRGEWSPADADADLRRLGSRAGATGAFSPQVGAQKADFARQLGTAVNGGAVRFQWREVAPGAPPEGRIRPLWVADVVAMQAGQAVSYRLEYEPVGGRLVGITRTGGAR